METMTAMTLLNATEGKTYSIKDVNTEDDDMKEFLFRLGCYSGEPITVITKKRKHSIVAIKDGRYSLDNNICEAIVI
jgi:ferrous iron transport protein A